MNSTASEKEAPEAQNNPPEAAPLLRIPRLSREQLMALFDESSSSEEEDDIVPIIPPGGSQPPASLAPGDPRPVSNMSSRYNPSTPMGDRMQDTEESSEDEKPPMDPEELNQMAGRILEATSPASEADKEPQAGPSRQQGPSLLRYSLYNT